MINFQIDAGDKILENHLNSCSKTATCISKTTQNKLLPNIKDLIQSKIVNEVKNQSIGPLYGIMVDEVTDTSNKEQLGLVLRYTIGNNVVERLYEYVDCKSITGESVCRGIVSILESAQLPVSDCRAQTYDGARNMAGQQRGCAARFQRLAPKAPYFHCASHDLNLALSKACDISDIQCILNVIKTVGILFKYSPRKQVLQEECVEFFNRGAVEYGTKTIYLRKVKLLCDTRWVERHTSIFDFYTLFGVIIYCLEIITQNDDESRK